MTQPKDSKTEVSTDLTARREGIDAILRPIIRAATSNASFTETEREAYLGRQIDKILSLLPSPTAQGESLSREAVAHVMAFMEYRLAGNTALPFEWAMEEATKSAVDCLDEADEYLAHHPASAQPVSGESEAVEKSLDQVRTIKARIKSGDLHPAPAQPLYATPQADVTGLVEALSGSGR